MDGMITIRVEMYGYESTTQIPRDLYYTSKFDILDDTVKKLEAQIMDQLDEPARKEMENLLNQLIRDDGILDTIPNIARHMARIYRENSPMQKE